MMDVFPKFIIEGDELIIGKVTYHKQLATNIENVKGGGWWFFGHEKTSFTLFGDSSDFGRASLEDIKKCISEKKVFNNHRNISENYTFFYKDSCGEVKQLNNLENESM